MAIRQQQCIVILELLDGTTGAKWVDPNPSSSILEEINVDIYKDATLIDSRTPSSRISDNLISLVLAGGAGGDTDSSSIFLEATYSGIDDIIIPSVQILLNDFDSVSIVEPSGRAKNYRQMVVQLYMRFFNKVVKDSDTIDVYDEDNTSPTTTQSYTEVGDTTTVNKAEHIS